jgi:glucose/arabinose dehydrogenase
LSVPLVQDAPAPSGGTSYTSSPTTSTPEIIATNLTIPWEIAFLPDGDLLVTERPGRLIRLGQDQSVIQINGVKHIGEGGLLGLALHPDFNNNRFIYLYFTSETNAGLTNRVERYQLDGTTLSDRLVIIDNIPGARNHDGGRLAFGPDRKLYITTGDASAENNAQDRNSLAGKILRVNDDGTTPNDNPFGSAIFSLGHRNPQGLAWDSSGSLWATEHGRSGALSGYDEINLIESGKNYGWPRIQGDQQQAGLESPQYHSGAFTTWAPSGAVFIGEDLYFAGLRGQALYRARISGSIVASITPYFNKLYGRLRTVALGPDGALYLLTGNRDGRGTVQEGDDKIIRISNPASIPSL